MKQNEWMKTPLKSFMSLANNFKDQLLGVFFGA